MPLERLFQRCPGRSRKNSSAASAFSHSLGRKRTPYLVGVSKVLSLEPHARHDVVANGYESEAWHCKAPIVLKYNANQPTTISKAINHQEVQVKQ